jgi:hypothetical protein
MTIVLQWRVIVLFVACVAKKADALSHDFYSMLILWLWIDRLNGQRCCYNDTHWHSCMLLLLQCGQRCWYNVPNYNLDALISLIGTLVAAMSHTNDIVATMLNIHTVVATRSTPIMMLLYSHTSPLLQCYTTNLSIQSHKISMLLKSCDNASAQRHLHGVV